MRELKILYRREWLIYGTYVLAGIGTPILMTLLSLLGESEDFSGSFNGVYNTALLMGGIGCSLYLEHENRQQEVGCFVVNRKRYMQFRIVQSIARGIVLAIVLMVTHLFWRCVIPGGAEFLDTAYAASTAESCIACGIVLIFMNAVSILDSTRRKPLLSHFVESEKRKNTIAANYRPATSAGKRFLGGILYYIIIVIGNFAFQVIIHENTMRYRMVAYAIIGAVCVGLWVVAYCFMRKKEFGQ